MAKQLQLRRGTTQANDLFTGANGEVTVDTTKHGLRVHDGSTQGGYLVDTVVFFQRPTQDNGYTWARKYASGWVEQGGFAAQTSTDVNATVTLPVTMSDTNYDIFTTVRNNNANAGFANVDNGNGITTTGFSFRIVNKYNLASAPIGIYWRVEGMAA